MPAKSRTKVLEESVDEQELVKATVLSTIQYFYRYDPTTDIYRGAEYIAGEVMERYKEQIIESLS